MRASRRRGAGARFTGQASRGGPSKSCPLRATATPSCCVFSERVSRGQASRGGPSGSGGEAELAGSGS